MKLFSKLACVLVLGTFVLVSGAYAQGDLGWEHLSKDNQFWLRINTIPDYRDTCLVLLHRGPTGSRYGAFAEVRSTSGTGGYFEATSTSGVTYGVYGAAQSTTGTGVLGLGVAASGANYGVAGLSNSIDGYGVYGSNVAGGWAIYGYGPIGSNAQFYDAVAPVEVTGAGQTVMGTDHGIHAENTGTAVFYVLFQSLPAFFLHGAEAYLDSAQLVYDFDAATDTAFITLGAQTPGCGYVELAAADTVEGTAGCDSLTLLGSTEIFEYIPILIVDPNDDVGAADIKIMRLKVWADYNLVAASIP